jgi:hypothetical protein
MTHIVEWAKHYWKDLQTPLGFKSKQPPNATTLSRALAKLDLHDFHHADGTPIHMLNLFVHDFHLILAEFSVKGDKTNEAHCLKQHVEEFFAKYPFVQLLTGDAAFTTRPLLQVLKDLGKDYLFCVKNNQPTLLESMVQTFADVNGEEIPCAQIEKKEAA